MKYKIITSSCDYLWRKGGLWLDQCRYKTSKADHKILFLDGGYEGVCLIQTGHTFFGVYVGDGRICICVSL